MRGASHDVGGGVANGAGVVERHEGEPLRGQAGVGAGVQDHAVGAVGVGFQHQVPNVRQAAANSLGKEWRPILVAGEDRYGNFPLAERPFPE